MREEKEEEGEEKEKEISNGAREWSIRMCSGAISPTTTAPLLDSHGDHDAAKVLKVESLTNISLIMIFDLFNLGT
jgi:hypothetical protein